MRPHKTYATALTACLLAASFSSAQTRSFTGNGDGASWSDPNNWSDNNAPDTSGEDVSIDTGGVWNVSLSDPNTTAAGQLSLGGDDTLTVSSSLGLTGIDALAGELVIAPGAGISVGDSWQNDGIITLHDFGFLDMSSGTNTFLNSPTGVVRGEQFYAPLGLLAQNFVNQGTISPGFHTHDGKSLAFTTALTLDSSSVLDIEIGGGTTDVNYDNIDGVSNVSLGGQLKLTQFNDYVPDPAVKLTILQSILTDGITGAFTNVADGKRLLTTDGSGSWLVQYGQNHAVSDVTLSDFQLAIPGDLNVDLYVGLDDLQIILDHGNQYVTPGDPSQGDVAGPTGAPDGYVGLDDLQTILDNWNTGTPPNPNATNLITPEPTTLLTLSLLAFPLLKRATPQP